MLGGEEPARPAEARLNLVEAEERAVAAAELLRALEDVVAKAERMPRALMGFALKAARAGVAAGRSA